MRRVIFLDRDGVLNANVFYRDTNAWEAPRRRKDFQWLPGVLTALQKLQANGFDLILVSNQPNIALSKSTRAEIAEIHDAMVSELNDHRISFLDYCYCLHHPRGVVPELSGTCCCRKPSSYWLLWAARRYAVDLRASWMIGDRATDTACGIAAGVRSIRIAGSVVQDRHAVWQTTSLASAADFLLSTLGHSHERGFELEKLRA